MPLQQVWEIRIFEIIKSVTFLAQIKLFLLQKYLQFNEYAVLQLNLKYEVSLIRHQ